MGIPISNQIFTVLELLASQKEKLNRRPRQRQDWEVEASTSGRHGYVWIGSTQVAQLGKSNKGATKGRAFLLWTPKKQGGILPMLNLSWRDLDGSQPVFRVRLGFFVRRRATMGGREKLGFSGMRWETPECHEPDSEEESDDTGNDKKPPGRHDFFHCQPIRGFEKGDKLASSLACDWFPDALPTVPVPAQNPFDLLWFALYSIYEKEWIQLFRAQKRQIGTPECDVKRLLRWVGHA